MKKLILASQSPRRKELLLEHGFQFEIIPSHTAETLDPKLTPAQNALLIAKQKALEVAQKKEGIILAADTIVEIKNKILGKPKNKIKSLQPLSSMIPKQKKKFQRLFQPRSPLKNSLLNLLSTISQHIILSIKPGAMRFKKMEINS